MVVRNMLPSIIILSSKANSNETKIIFYVVGKRPFFIFENCDFQKKKGLEVAFYVFFYFQGVDNWNFDTFGLNRASKGTPLRYLGYELLTRHGCLHKYKVSLLM